MDALTLRPTSNGYTGPWFHPPLPGKKCDANDNLLDGRPAVGSHPADGPGGGLAPVAGPQARQRLRETGIVAELPDKLPVKWRAPVELGYAGPAVAAGRVFVCDYVRTTGEITNNYDMSIAAPPVNWTITCLPAVSATSGR